MKRVLLLALLFLALPSCAGEPGQLYRRSFDSDWKFFKGDDPAYSEAAFDDASWRSLDLPHDWGVEGPFVQSYPGETGKLEWWGTAWYRKHFSLPDRLPAGLKSPRYYVDFDGVLSNSTVYINGHEVGGRPYGYSSFRVEIGPWLQKGDNVIAVRVDNKPNSSRWYPGGGIYRHVFLVASASVGVDWNGTWVRSEGISESGTATISIATTLRTQAPSRVEVVSSVPLPGKPFFGVASESIETRTKLEQVTDGQVVKQTLKVPRARLWSPSDPQVYRLITTVRNLDTGEIERYETPFGIRTAEFRSEGFFLNGERFFIQGVCLHHDSGALGAVWNEDVWERRLAQLKELGCNAIRCAHNPPAPQLLDLCDRMGFLVIDELTDTWTIAKKPEGYATLFADWAERDLVDMIRRDRNHPSVILWSIGNECAEQGYPDKWDIPRRLTEICHREDPTRLTTSGNDNVWGAFQPYHETVDVFGFNYKPDHYKRFHEQFPNQPFYGSETASCIGTRGYYLFPVSDDKGKGWGEGAPWQVSAYGLYAPYWACSPDHEWACEDENPSFCGEFVWSGFDYIGEPTPFNFDPTVLTNFHDEKARADAERELELLSRNAPPSRSSYFGIFDLAGFPKDIYWLYQSRWRQDFPMAHILPHWTWPGREGQVTPIHVFTSADSGELFVGGVSHGVRRRAKGEYRLRWDDVVYEPGEVAVVTWKDGREWARDTVRTAGEPERLELEAESGRNGMIFVTAKVVDKDGRLVPVASNRLTFRVEGPARLLAADAGDPTSHVPFSSPSLPAFGGLCSAVIMRDGPQKVSVKVSSPGLADAVVRIDPGNQAR